MKEEVLVSFKEDLLQKRSALLERLGKIESSKKKRDPLSADSNEQALELENHEVVDALDELEQKELKALDQALERIDKGSFGVCAECGESISENRLKALPFASMCIACVNED